jgi:hypothetical protein
MSTDIITEYGYEKTEDGGVTCVACGDHFPVADGSVMRGHGRRCTVNPRSFYVPAVCNS